MAEEKTYGEQLNDKLTLKFKNAWNETTTDKKEIMDFCEDYKKFLDTGKTEREVVQEILRLAEEKGFRAINSYKNQDQKLKSGDKVYRVNKGKNIILGVIGQENIQNGINILGAHIDSPRLDLKQVPLYENTEMAFLKTHYYGGIKKYQWVTIPLALHGVIITQDGRTITLNIGEKEEDPVFYITDLLPHLAQDQMQKKMSEAIEGEQLNIIVGSMPIKDEKAKEKVKLCILEYLNKEYGIVEEDFISAEIEIVPAYKAKDIGFDRAMLGAYGQDDRVCAYTELRALFELINPEKTCMCIFSDKEEIGSDGNTGSQSVFFENTVAETIDLLEENYSDIKLRRALENSKMLSADVNCGVDPNYEGLQDTKNASFMGKGIVITKYTGSRGKYDSSDANAEFLAQVIKTLKENKIIYQTGELGKVDKGGGGTIAKYLARYNMEVLDCGVAVLSMHSPYEVTSKVDIYETYKAYKVFLEKMN